MAKYKIEVTVGRNVGRLPFYLDLSSETESIVEIGVVYDSLREQHGVPDARIRLYRDGEEISWQDLQREFQEKWKKTFPTSPTPAGD